MSKQRFELYWEEESGDIWGNVTVEDNLIIVSAPTHVQLLAKAKYAVHRFHGIPVSDISFIIKNVDLRKEDA